MPTQVPPSSTDEELNRYIRTRYDLLGTDISVLYNTDNNG